jgi:hypothetical protein
MPVRCIVYVGLIWLWALYGFVSAWIRSERAFPHNAPAVDTVIGALAACAEMAYGLGFIVIATVVGSVLLERYRKEAFESRKAMQLQKPTFPSELAEIPVSNKENAGED